CIALFCAFFVIQKPFSDHASVCACRFVSAQCRRKFLHSLRQRSSSLPFSAASSCFRLVHPSPSLGESAAVEGSTACLSCGDVATAPFPGSSVCIPCPADSSFTPITLEACSCNVGTPWCSSF